MDGEKKNREGNVSDIITVITSTSSTIELVKPRRWRARATRENASGRIADFVHVNDAIAYFLSTFLQHPPFQLLELAWTRTNTMQEFACMVIVPCWL